MNNQRPYIVKFENQVSQGSFDVVINHESFEEAKEWAIGYFGPMQYLHSDFDGNHTFRRIG